MILGTHRALQQRVGSPWKAAAIELRAGGTAAIRREPVGQST